MLPLFILSQELTYVPDDNFETYLETYFPACDNGIDNDDYVLKSGLIATEYTGSGTINISSSYMEGPVFDLTGIEDVEDYIEEEEVKEEEVKSDEFNASEFKEEGE